MHKDAEFGHTLVLTDTCTSCYTKHIDSPNVHGFKVGDKVNVWVSAKDDYVLAEIIRVYDEETYRQEHYPPNGVNPHYTDTYNEGLVDVKFANGKVSKAHFISGLKVYNE